MMYFKTIIKKLPFARDLVRKARDLQIYISNYRFIGKYRHMVSGKGRFICCDKRVKATLSVGQGSRIHINGNIIFKSDIGGVGSSHICIGENATFIVNGDFVIGPNVQIILSEGAMLTIGGKNEASASGITCDSKVMVNRKLSIGTDCIIAWGVFITDCDWHGIAGRTSVTPTHIADKVWIAHNASILKGTRIGIGCVVAAHSVCCGRDYPPHALLAGAPAKVAREHIQWSREMALEMHT